MRRVYGFTLIELIIILFLFAVLAVFFVMKISSTSLYNLSSVTEQLRRDVRYTQILATSLDASYSLVISANGYYIKPNPPNGAYSISMPTGITLSTVTILFNAMGATTSASTITITSSSGNTNTLTIAAETGFLSG